MHLIFCWFLLWCNRLYSATWSTGIFLIGAKCVIFWFYTSLFYHHFPWTLLTVPSLLLKFVLHLTHYLLPLARGGLTAAGRAMQELGSICKGSVRSSLGACHQGTQQFTAMLRTKEVQEASSVAMFSFPKCQQQSPCLWYDWTRGAHRCGEGNGASPTPLSYLWVGGWVAWCLPRPYSKVCTHVEGGFHSILRGEQHPKILGFIKPL